MATKKLVQLLLIRKFNLRCFFKGVKFKDAAMAINNIPGVLENGLLLILQTKFWLVKRRKRTSCFLPQKLANL